MIEQTALCKIHLDFLGPFIRKNRLMLFALFLLFYMVILGGNLLILLMVFPDPRLHTPMYFFLSNLSFVDIAYSSATAPKMIADFVSEKKIISYWGCVTQMFTFHFFGCTEIFVLTVMAFDRYAAICQPLRYANIMSTTACTLLASLSWLGGLAHSFVQTLLTFQLPFCSSQIRPPKHALKVIHLALPVMCTRKSNSLSLDALFSSLIPRDEQSDS